MIRLDHHEMTTPENGIETFVHQTVVSMFCPPAAKMPAENLRPTAGADSEHTVRRISCKVK